MSDVKKVAWVTGASSGIGLATGSLLARRGYLTVFTGRDEDRLKAATDKLKAENLAVDYVAVDITIAFAVNAAVKEIIGRHGRIDVLVANAGSNVGARAWGDVSAENFSRLFAVNVNGVFHCVDAALPHMRAQKSGQVVVVSSWAGVHVSAKPGPGYTASKHAAVALAESLNAAEFGNGIRACAVCPGEVATPAMAKRAVPPSESAMKRMLQPDDIARTIAFVVEAPPHMTLNRIVLSPTWNGAFGAPQDG